MYIFVMEYGVTLTCYYTVAHTEEEAIDLLHQEHNTRDKNMWRVRRSFNIDTPRTFW